MSTSAICSARHRSAAMVNRAAAAVLGAATGLVVLIGMLRLILGAFAPSALTVGFVLVPMIAWVGYVAHRARRGRLTRRRAYVVGGCAVTGLVTVWLSVLGPVIALALSLLAFGLIWVGDRPVHRSDGEHRFARIEELTDDFNE